MTDLVRHRLTPPTSGGRVTYVRTIAYIDLCTASDCWQHLHTYNYVNYRCIAFLRPECNSSTIEGIKAAIYVTDAVHHLGCMCMKPKQLQIVSSIISSQDDGAVVPTAFKKCLYFTCLHVILCLHFDLVTLSGLSCVDIASCEWSCAAYNFASTTCTYKEHAHTLIRIVFQLQNVTTAFQGDTSM